jgi:hypothetical protein
LLDKFIESPEIKPVLSRYFELCTLEMGSEPISNPGAMDYDVQYGGKGKGTPFIALLDSNGKLIINSLENGHGNIGFPHDSNEIEWFIHMLKTAAPNLTKADLAKIEGKLRAFKK